jgi:hypothetical protein
MLNKDLSHLPIKPQSTDTRMLNRNEFSPFFLYQQKFIFYPHSSSTILLLSLIGSINLNGDAHAQEESSFYFPSTFVLHTFFSASLTSYTSSYVFEWSVILASISPSLYVLGPFFVRKEVGGSSSDTLRRSSCCVIIPRSDLHV